MTTAGTVDVQAIVDRCDQLNPQPIDRVTAAVNELVAALQAVGGTPAAEIAPAIQTLRGFRRTCARQVNAGLADLYDRGVDIHGSVRNLAEDLGMDESSIREHRSKYSR